MKVECEYCNGTGKVNCETCHGEGEVTCPDCGGSGRDFAVCPHCHEGRVIDPRGVDDSDTLPCPVCNGNFKTEKGQCRTCGGTGKVRCETCGGSGTIPCDQCTGTGQVDIDRIAAEIIVPDWYDVARVDKKINADEDFLEDESCLSMLRKAADGGSGLACYVMGVIESEKDPSGESSFTHAGSTYFDKGAELADANCLYANAVVGMSEAGADWKCVIDGLQRAADMGHLHALVDLAICLYTGQSGHKSIAGQGNAGSEDKQIAACCEKLAAVKSEDRTNRHLVAKAHALGNFLPKVLQGDSGSMLELGKCFNALYAETGCRDDQVASGKWMELAAANGNAEAARMLAQVKKGDDIGLAILILDKAAERGDKKSKEELKKFMEECLEDQTKFDELKNLGDGGNVAAMKFVAKAYRDGRAGAGEAGKENAFLWTQKAAEAADGTSMLELSILLRDGKGCERDINRAFSLAYESINNGASKRRAIRLLAEFYRRGRFAAPDHGKANQLYARSANAGYAPAIVQIGRSYLEGWGVKKDLGEAKRLFEMAKEKNSSEAIDELKKIPSEVKVGKKPISGVTGTPPKGPLPEFVQKDYAEAKAGNLWSQNFEKRRNEAKKSGKSMCAVGSKKRWLFILLGIVFAGPGLQFVYAKRWGWWILHLVLLGCGVAIPPVLGAAGLLWLGSLLFMKKDGKGDLMA